MSGTMGFGMGGDNLTALYLMNPQLAGALRRQQMGAQLAQAGSDYSPIRSPTQGLARIAQGILGGILMGGAQRQITEAAKANNDALSAALGRGNTILEGGAATQPPSVGLPAPQPTPSAAPTGAGPLGPTIQQASAGSGVPAPIIASMVSTESGGNPGVVNPQSGATGAAQVLPSTAAQPGYGMQPLPAADMTNPAKEVPWAARYLAARGQAANGGQPVDWNNPQQASAALNAYGGDPSGRYAQKVLAGAESPGAPPASPRAPPQAPSQLPTGMNAPMVQRGLALMQEGQRNMMSMDPRMRMLGQSQMQEAQTIMGLDTVVPDTMNGVAGQRNVRTGQFTPLVTGTGRAARDAAGNLYELPPGGGAPRIISPANLGNIAQTEEAKAAGAGAGKQAVKTVDDMARMGQEAIQGIGTIDSARAQLAQSTAHGLPSGYFTPALAAAAAGAKSLGIDTKSLGVDPAAVGDIQAARKSLALVAGSILRQILGPGTEITNDKLEAFIHATPGIETDPKALDRIMMWARSQMVYNHDMAMDAMRNAGASGMISPSWRPQYFAKHGFGPIYNPLTQEMQQPDGQLPSENPPPLPKAHDTSPPLAPGHSQYYEGQTATYQGKKLVFRNGIWNYAQ